MMPLTPKQKYQHDLETSGFTPDPAQARAVESLDSLYHTLFPAELKTRFKQLLHFKKKEKGIYLWGNVGSGKTYLLDLFYQSIPDKKKRRLHFYEFMQWVHAELKTEQGERDPLLKIAKKFSKNVRVLCFDEFFVKDIADAMVLGRLLEALFTESITLVATSNIPLSRLYQDGLQRERFLPTIELLQNHLLEIQVDNHVDYRLKKIDRHHVFFHPINEYTEKAVTDLFLVYAKQSSSVPKTLSIHQRDFFALSAANGVVWFDFVELCDKPRVASDYLQLTSEYHTIFLSHVPIFYESREQENAAARFIQLIDVLYSEQVRIVLQCAAPIEKLYQGKRSSFVFQRTLSRLEEMQSKEYFEKCLVHRYKHVGIF